MKKIIYIAIAVVIAGIVGGCGVTHSPIPTPVSPDKLLQDGWNAYDNGDYETAAAKFDSVISIDVLNVEGHLGYAWSKGMLGELNEARSFFRILEIVAFGVTCTPLNIDSNIVAYPVETSWGDTVYALRITNPPVVRVTKIVANDRSTYNPIYFGDDEIWLNERPSNDTMRIYYFSYDNNVVLDSVKDDVAWGYAGYGASYLSDETGEEDYAIYGLKASLEIIGPDTVTFSHRPHLNSDKIKALLALAFFRYGMYKNTVDILVNDFGWNEWNDSYNPFSVEKRIMILQELEKVVNSYGK